MVDPVGQFARSMTGEAYRQLEFHSSEAMPTPSTESSQSPAAAATPPSSADSSSASQFKPRNIQYERNILLEEFLARLDNYVAVGSLRLITQKEQQDAEGRVLDADIAPDDGWLETSLAWFDGLWTEPDKTVSSLRSLLASRWARLFYKFCSPASTRWVVVIRIYLLPDDVGRKYIDRSSRNARNALKHVMSIADASADKFHARASSEIKESCQDVPGDHESLFYVFNTLESPDPDPGRVLDADSRGALMDVLDNNLQGLKTPLYPYQSRSAAKMIQRESSPSLMLDPRYETRTSATGQQYFFDAETGKLLREKIMYEEARGGILAETMGYGKTLICLAVILATKGHWPRIPPQYSEIIRTRDRTGSLMEMAAARIGTSSLPWRPRLEQLERHGEHYTKCIDACERNGGVYVIPPPPARYPGREARTCDSKVPSSTSSCSFEGSRIRPRGKHVMLCPATLVIVPANLLVQWQQEIARHTEGLKVLEIHQAKDKIPPADELKNYDVVLISKPRFEKESPDLDSFLGKDTEIKTVYRSPLMDLHWLRIIVDEGHSFALSGHRTNAVHVLDQLHVERRWIVSGTPSNGLMGVEVGLAANETMNEVPNLPGGNSAEALHHDEDRVAASTPNLALDARKTSFSYKEEIKDLEKLRVIVQDFLKLQPWANSLAEDPASWSKYIMPYDKNGRKRKSTFSLRTTLNGLIVRHRIEDVEKDLSLPPLHNKVTYLVPCFFDKMSINLFILVLVVNAVTSERTDKDYMFHPTNRKQLNELMNNLRESGFWWVGTNLPDLNETLRMSKSYLEKNEGKDKDPDRNILQRAIEIGDAAICNSTWRAFNLYKEIGVFIDSFPDFAREAWAMSSSQTDPLLLGTIEAKLVQKKVNSELALQQDPVDGLVGAGLRAMQDAKKRADAAAPRVPVSCAADGTKLKRKLSSSNDSSPAKSRIPISSLKTEGGGANTLVSPTTSKAMAKITIPSDSPVARTRIVGTASAKLTYLIDRVLRYQAKEKIIIFYEGNNIAYYIAEALELLGVQFLIYANTLNTARRAIYLATFNQTESFRVLLMDLKQAAHGLHVACASRVYIVNPIWQPSVEAQAIKRAHRIGQTRPVYVETLVLQHTLEDKMLRRRKNMTNQELQQAEKSLLDDTTMSSIIQNETLIPISDEEMTGYGQMAMLETPQPLFGEGRACNSSDENLVLPEGTPVPTQAPQPRRMISFVDDPIPCLESDVIPTPTKKKRPSIRLRMPNNVDEEVDDGSITMVPSLKRKSRKSAMKGKSGSRRKGCAFAVPESESKGFGEEDSSHAPTPVGQLPLSGSKGTHQRMTIPFLLSDTNGYAKDASSSPPRLPSTGLPEPPSFSTPVFPGTGSSLFGGSPLVARTSNVARGLDSVAFWPFDAEASASGT